MWGIAEKEAPRPWGGGRRWSSVRPFLSAPHFHGKSGSLRALPTPTPGDTRRGAELQRGCRQSWGWEDPADPAFPGQGSHQAPDSPLSPGLPREDWAPRRSGESSASQFPSRGVPDGMG